MTAMTKNRTGHKDDDGDDGQRNHSNGSGPCCGYRLPPYFGLMLLTTSFVAYSAMILITTLSARDSMSTTTTVTMMLYPMDFWVFGITALLALDMWFSTRNETATLAFSSLAMGWLVKGFVSKFVSTTLASDNNASDDSGNHIDNASVLQSREVLISTTVYYIFWTISAFFLAATLSAAWRPLHNSTKGCGRLAQVRISFLLILVSTGVLIIGCVVGTVSSNSNVTIFDAGLISWHVSTVLFLVLGASVWGALATEQTVTVWGLPNSRASLPLAVTLIVTLVLWIFATTKNDDSSFVYLDLAIYFGATLINYLVHNLLFSIFSPPQGKDEKEQVHDTESSSSESSNGLHPIPVVVANGSEMQGVESDIFYQDFLYLSAFFSGQKRPATASESQQQQQQQKTTAIQEDDNVELTQAQRSRDSSGAAINRQLHDDIADASTGCGSSKQCCGTPKSKIESPGGFFEWVYSVIGFPPAPLQKEEDARNDVLEATGKPIATEGTVGTFKLLRTEKVPDRNSSVGLLSWSGLMMLGQHGTDELKDSKTLIDNNEKDLEVGAVLVAKNESEQKPKEKTKVFKRQVDERSQGYVPEFLEINQPKNVVLSSSGESKISQLTTHTNAGCVFTQYARHMKIEQRQEPAKMPPTGADPHAIEKAQRLDPGGVSTSPGQKTGDERQICTDVGSYEVIEEESIRVDDASEAQSDILHQVQVNLRSKRVHKAKLSVDDLKSSGKQGHASQVLASNRVRNWADRWRRRKSGTLENGPSIRMVEKDAQQKALTEVNAAKLNGADESELLRHSRSSKDISTEGIKLLRGPSTENAIADRQLRCLGSVGSSRSVAKGGKAKAFRVQHPAKQSSSSGNLDMIDEPCEVLAEQNVDVPVEELDRYQAQSGVSKMRKMKIVHHPVDHDGKKKARRSKTDPCHDSDASGDFSVPTSVPGNPGRSSDDSVSQIDTDTESVVSAWHRASIAKFKSNTTHVGPVVAHIKINEQEQSIHEDKSLHHNSMDDSVEADADEASQKRVDSGNRENGDDENIDGSDHSSIPSQLSCSTSVATSNHEQQEGGQDPFWSFLEEAGKTPDPMVVTKRSHRLPVHPRTTSKYWRLHQPVSTLHGALPIISEGLEKSSHSKSNSGRRSNSSRTVSSSQRLGIEVGDMELLVDNDADQVSLDFRRGDGNDDLMAVAPAEDWRDLLDLPP